MIGDGFTMILYHPHIIRAFHILQVSNKLAQVMEFAVHGTLSELVCSIGAFLEPGAWRMFRELFSGLSYMHGRSIAHRDLKLENILLNHRWVPKLADFSFSVYYDEASPCRNVCGSVPYFAPELLAHEPYNPLLSDVWAVAVCLYIMTNDTFPFPLGDDKAQLEAERARAWQFRPRTESTYTAAYKALMRRMLEPEVERRIRTEEIEDHEWILTEQVG